MKFGAEVEAAGMAKAPNVVVKWVVARQPVIILCFLLCKMHYHLPDDKQTTMATKAITKKNIMIY